MSHGLRYLLWLLTKFLFSVRYRVHVDGLENIKGLKKTLILPNHPAYIDPPLVLCSLWPALKPRRRRSRVRPPRASRVSVAGSGMTARTEVVKSYAPGPMDEVLGHRVIGPTDEV